MVLCGGADIKITHLYEIPTSELSLFFYHNLMTHMIELMQGAMLPHFWFRQLVLSGALYWRRKDPQVLY